jgi:hypothetical protein
LLARELERLQIPADGFEIRLLGNPVFYPQHDKFHFPGTNKPEKSASESSAIHGTIVGAAGATATLTISGPQTTTARNLSIDRDGRFAIETLAAGKYRLKAKCPGFKTIEHLLELKPRERRELRIELKPGSADETIVVPEPKRRFHSPPTSIVSFAAVRGGQIHHVFRVFFDRDEGRVLYHPDPFQIPLDEQEWSRIEHSFDRFYSTALDIGKSSHRFYAFLPEDMHSYGASDQTGWTGIPRAAERELSAEKVRQIVALWLDFHAHYTWLVLEGTPVRMADLIPVAWKDPSRVRRLIHALSAAVHELKSNLADVGAANTEHIAVSRDYMHSLLGKSTFIKIANGHHMAGLPADTTSLYRVVFGTLHLFFRINGDDVQLVRVLFD